VKLALVQLDLTVGDFEGNRRRILEGAAKARERGARVAVFPELAITGYPPLDLLERSRFVEAALEAERAIVRSLPDGLIAVFGTIRRRPTPPVAGRALENIAVAAERGRVLARVVKSLIPTYDVFDEARYFEPKRDDQRASIEVDGLRVAITICEDLWNDDDLWENHDLWRDKAPGSYRLYAEDPIRRLADRERPDVVLNISASPWAWAKEGVRREILSHVANKHGVWLVYVNHVGGNDGLLFDGHSTVYTPDGRHAGTAAGWREDVYVVDLESGLEPAIPERAEAEEIREALTLGIRDYLHKTGIPLAILGLSGGIDSAVTAYLAVRALGPDRVVALTMPSRHSSAGSVDDAELLAANLGIRLWNVSIEPMFRAFLDALEPVFEGREEDVTEENIQSRIRGVLLMAAANKLGGVVLNTGNKSEAAMGYATLYGDAIGALSVLGDLYKHQVYEQAELANREREIIPRSSIEKAPSAELRPGQRDEDSLPPYAQLDEMLRLFIEHRATVDEVVAAVGVESAVARQVNRSIYRAEFKRKQLPPTLRVSRKAWVGRVFPIVQRFDE
jgi:NAD+ synthase (glutamine-hydrolysing)